MLFFVLRRSKTFRDVCYILLLSASRCAVATSSHQRGRHHTTQQNPSLLHLSHVTFPTCVSVSPRRQPRISNCLAYEPTRRRPNVILDLPQRNPSLFSFVSVLPHPCAVRVPGYHLPPLANAGRRYIVSARPRLAAAPRRIAPCRVRRVIRGHMSASHRHGCMRASAPKRLHRTSRRGADMWTSALSYPPVLPLFVTVNI